MAFLIYFIQFFLRSKTNNSLDWLKRHSPYFIQTTFSHTQTKEIPRTIQTKRTACRWGSLSWIVNAPHGSIKYIMKASLQQNIFLIRTKHDSFLFYIFSKVFVSFSCGVQFWRLCTYERRKKRGPMLWSQHIQESQQNWWSQKKVKEPILLHRFHASLFHSHQLTHNHTHTRCAFFAWDIDSRTHYEPNDCSVAQMQTHKMNISADGQNANTLNQLLNIFGFYDFVYCAKRSKSK